MKVIYDKQTGTLLDATHAFIGDIDPYEQTTDAAMVKEVLRQNRPLYEFENEKDAEDKKGCQEPEVSQEPFGVWICYITDNYENPVVVKLVSTDVQAMEWVQGTPRTIGLIDDETRNNRFVEHHIVEVERP